MSTLEITSVSAKGQVVIPAPIRNALGIDVGTKLAVVTDGNNVLMKPVEAPKMEEFRELAAESRAAVRKVGLKQSVVKKALRKVRDAHRR